METLLGILLYIGAVSTNVEYTGTQIDAIEAQNLTTITAIEADPTQLNAAINELDDVTIEMLGGDKIVMAEEIDW